MKTDFSTLIFSGEFRAILDGHNDSVRVWVLHGIKQSKVKLVC